MIDKLSKKTMHKIINLFDKDNCTTLGDFKDKTMDVKL